MLDVGKIQDALGMPSGPASAVSGSPGYTCLLAMVAAGDARYLGDQYFTDGSRAIMADVLPAGRGTANNPEEMHLIIDPGYFERAEQEYSTPWKLVWWREAIQNAVDAGADSLSLEVLDDGEDLVRVTCEDLGSGMDKDTLQFKFLALGGTTKGRAGQIGGFGVAKKILCFRWPRWMIHTREHVLTSENGKMEYRTAQYRRGTKLQVWMPREGNMFTTSFQAMNFLDKCDLRGVDVIIDGKSHKPRWLPNGRLIRDLQGGKADAKVYYTKESKLAQGACYVRTSEGLFMHERYLSSEIKGYVIIELVAKVDPKTGQPHPSRDFLSASRDDLTDQDLKESISKFLNELAVETKSGLKSKAGAKVQKFVGTGGKFKPEFKQLYSSVLYNMETEKTQSGVQLTEEARKRMAELLGSSTELNAELASALLRAKYGAESQVETALFHIASGFWKRDFLLYPDPDLNDPRIPKRFNPQYQTPRLHKLARTWADMCMYTMIALNSRHEFGVGWVFSNDMMACYLKRDGENWLLLNPFIIGDKALRRLGFIDDMGERKEEHPEWSPTDSLHLRSIFSLAIHECTHFVDDIDYHGEAFSSALTFNTALAGPGFAMIERIARAARAAVRGEREKPVDQERESIE